MTSHTNVSTATAIGHIDQSHTDFSDTSMSYETNNEKKQGHDNEKKGSCKSYVSGGPYPHTTWPSDHLLITSKLIF